MTIAKNQDSVFFFLNARCTSGSATSGIAHGIQMHNIRGSYNEGNQHRDQRCPENLAFPARFPPTGHDPVLKGSHDQLPSTYLYAICRVCLLMKIPPSPPIIAKNAIRDVFCAQRHDASYICKSTGGWERREGGRGSML